MLAKIARLTLIGKIAYLECRAVLHEGKSALLVKCGFLLFLRHYLDVKIIVVLLLDKFYHTACDAHSVILRIHKDIVDICGQFPVVQRTDKSDKPAAVPCGNNR